MSYQKYQDAFLDYLRAKGYTPHPFASFNCSDKACSCYINEAPHLKDFTNVERASNTKFYVRLSGLDFNNIAITENLFQPYQN